MWRIEFKVGNYVNKQDFVLAKPAIEFFHFCRDKGLMPLIFEIESKNYSIEELEKWLKNKQGGLI